MRRFVRAFNEKNTAARFDVVIVGDGLAGLYTALNIDSGLRCAVISKASFKGGSSYLAQGGIAAVMADNDRIEKHLEDTIAAGAGICDPEAVGILVKEGPERIKSLMDAGFSFDTDDHGSIHLTREGGHSHNRILHCGGDATGKLIMEKLFRIIAARSNIELIENTNLLDILTEDDRAVGVSVQGEIEKVYLAPHIVICSGGIGKVYGSTTNPQASSGDGIAAAIRAGARVKDMEFVQFHPTALYLSEREKQCFLISEAVRGEGGRLVNHKKEYFMGERHPMADLAPRDIVAREIFKEMRNSHSPFLYLDITNRTKSFLMQRFPKIFWECQKHGLDISKQFIPIHPVQHYFMGGIQTDVYGRTSIEGLYACGESACTGVHGANRLASNSLLECLVFGRRCAEMINNSNHEAVNRWDNTSKKLERRMINSDEASRKVQSIMKECAGIVRNREGLEKSLDKIHTLLSDWENIELTEFRHIEAYNIALVGFHILKACLSRKESVGAHYRQDHSYQRGEKVC